MDTKFNSILNELIDYAPSKDKDLFIESRAQQVIGSALNVIKLIRENYDLDTANDLVKRLIRSIDSGDEEKFRRKIKTIREHRNLK